MFGIQSNKLQEIPGALLLRTQTTIMDVKDYFLKGIDDKDIPKVYDSLLPGWKPEASQVSDSNPVIDATAFRQGFGLFPFNAKIRNDTRLPFCYIATKMQEPTQLDYAAAKHHAAYLWTTRQLAFCFHPASSVGKDTATDLLQATDGSWDPAFRDSRSVIAYLIMIGEANDPSIPCHHQRRIDLSNERHRHGSHVTNPRAIQARALKPASSMASATWSRTVKSRPTTNWPIH